MSNAIEGINALGERERARAYQIARARIAGDEPQIEDFARKVYSKYPPEFMRRMKRLGYLLLVPAFTPSAIRIFIAAYTVNAVYLSHDSTQLNLGLIAAGLIGLMSVLLAETGQVAFTLWAASVPDNAGSMRNALRVGAWGCLLFALTANIFIVQPYAQWENIVACALAWTETVLPPLLVLITANVLKSLSLHEIEDRHAAHVEYEAQHAAWMARIANAHQDASWMQIVANELRDAIRNLNRRSFAKLRALNNDDWRVLVLRELAADNWYVPAESPRIEAPASDDTQPPVPEKPKPVPRVRAAAQAVGTSNSSGRHTDEFANAVHANEDGTFVGVCPHCGKSTSVKDNARSAMAALIAHKRGCVALRDVDSLSVPVVQAAEAFINEVGNGEG